MTRWRARPNATADAFVGAELELRHITRRYGSSVAVDDISLTVHAGEFLTLLGPSGSGKTTTLNVIAGFTDATSGDVLMDGREIGNLPPHKRDIGMVFQHYALFPHMTVEENVAFPLRRRKVAKEERRARVALALELVRLGDRGGSYPRELSGGQQQRVALARAIVFHPRVLLMDEPLGALDKKLREWLQLEIKRIHSEVGITFVYVTHDQEEALSISDRVAICNDGKIEQVGQPDQLYEEPRTLFVADFLGESNVFEGTVERSGEETRLRGEGFTLRVPAQAAGTSGPAAMVVRPERLHLRRNGTNPSIGDNILRGRVRQIIYFGASRRIELEMPDRRRVLVREQAGPGASLTEGDTAEVFWSPDEARLLPRPAPEAQ